MQIMAANKKYPAAASSFTAEAVVFDGTNDYLRSTSPSCGSSNKTFTQSFWIYANSTTNGDRVFTFSDSSNLSSIMGSTFFNSNKILWFYRPTSAGAVILSCFANTTISTGQWYHIMCSFNQGTSAAHVYVDDTSSIDLLTQIDNTFAWAGIDGLTIGAQGSTPAGFLDCEIAELYHTNEYIDLSSESNRRKFISASGTPVDLGSQGQNPTGTQAIVYYSGNASVWNAGTNKGSAGNLTMTGAVTDSSNEPVAT